MWILLSSVVMILALALYLRTGVGQAASPGGDLEDRPSHGHFLGFGRDVDVCGGRRRGHGHDLDRGRGAVAKRPLPPSRGLLPGKGGDGDWRHGSLRAEGSVCAFLLLRQDVWGGDDGDPRLLVAQRWG